MNDRPDTTRRILTLIGAAIVIVLVIVEYIIRSGG